MDHGEVKPLDEGLLDRIDRYIEHLFIAPDEALSRNLQRADAAGLPAINVSATEGKLLYLITKIARARRVLEVGTLGGYSTTWFARALPEGGIVVTLEVDPGHAEVARESLRGVAPGVRVNVRVGDAATELQNMRAAREDPFDVVFIDADKPRYVEYLQLALELSRPGTVVLADNLIRHGVVLDPATADENARGARAYNEALAAHEQLESLIVPIVREKVDGLSISLVK
jgi:predicted O-methyltransferase YrrM